MQQASKQAKSEREPHSDLMEIIWDLERGNDSEK
jgi:hypothetical protein